MAVFSSLALIAGAASAYQTYQASQARAENLEFQAELSGLRAEQEQLRGEQAVTELRDALTRNLAANRAATYAAGISTDSGTYRRGETEAFETFAERSSLIESNADLRSASRRANMATAQRRAASERRAGIFRSASTLLDFGGRAMARGSTSGLPSGSTGSAQPAQSGG